MLITVRGIFRRAMPTHWSLGTWRIAAVMPLVGVVPVLILTFQGFRQHSNFWPILVSRRA